MDETEYLTGGRQRRSNKLKFKFRVTLMISIIICTSLLLALILVLTLKTGVQSCHVDPNNATQQNLYLYSAVASDASPCANIASNIMTVKGGNAVDGAIAGLLCNCAVNFHSCGIGGGAMLVIYIKKEKKVYTVDLREEAPASSNKNMFVHNPSESLIGGKSIAVMGLVSGYYEIHQRFGNLKWELLFQDTIDLLNNGFYVSKTIESAIDYFVRKGDKTKFKELWSVISNNVTGKPKTIGDVIKNPKLSKTLQMIAKDPFSMKNGSLADIVVEEIRAAGGNITKADLNNYKVKWRVPVKVELNDGQALYTMPPPSSGALIAFTLNVLSEYQFQSSSLDTCQKAGLFFHRFIETMKFAYAKRSALGDMDFVNVTSIMSNLTSDAYAKWIKSLITDDRTHPVSYYHQSYASKQDYGTAQFSLLSADGDAVSSTSTINYLFGSLVMGNETGILYNDEMDDFSNPNASNIYDLPPSPSNFIQPGKRPMSSMSPLIIVDKNGDATLVTGASGGSKIISATALVSTLTTLLHKQIKESIDQPRAHHQLLPDIVYVEPNFPKPIIEFLKKRKHEVVVDTDHAVVQGVHRSARDSRYIECNADFRKMGMCDGY